ncbi:unnamed protein product [Hermetia illucens]|uniref:Angiotensin-converting enzyme n=1 Tax=Hermetia illucens TaxID=343691 RepID=A0A7R8Z1I7_HERIL|nr:angiotensin-converting enzyme-like [Hermetia illucens]CAD7091968.1 unnamed protein product [Hermetia illucens]
MSTSVWIVVLILISKYNAAATNTSLPEEQEGYKGDEDYDEQGLSDYELLLELQREIQRLPLKSLRNQQEIFQLRNRLFKPTEEIASKMASLSLKAIDNEVLKRQLLNVKNSILLLNETVMNKFQNISSSISAIQRQNTICMYKNKTDCSLAYVPHVQDILRENDEQDALTYYWQAWNGNHSEHIRHLFNEWLEIVRNLLDSYLKPSEPQPISLIRYHQYEDTNFLSKLEKEVLKVQPLYQALHAYLRTIMRFLFESNSIQPRSSLPIHLLPYVIRHIEVKNPFTNEINAAFRDFDLAGMKRKRILGTFLTDLEGEVERLLSDKTTQTKDCLVDQYSTKERETYSQLYKDLFRKQYEKLTSSRPIGINQEPCPGFNDAIFKAIGLAIMSPHHLRNVGVIKDYNYSDGMRYYHLLEHAVPDMFDLLTHFVNEKFISSILDNEITSDDYTCKYWKVMNKFTGVKSGIDIENTSVPLLYSSHSCLWDMQFSMKRVFSEIVGFQIYKGLCLKANSTDPWQDCDFMDNEEAVGVLREALSLGAAKSWKYALKLLTGQEDIDIHPFLEYYQPLMILIEDKNKESGATVGWSEDIEDC